MNVPNSSCHHQPLTTELKSETPKATLTDLFAGIICFAVMFFLPLFFFYAFFGDAEAFGTGTGFGLFLCGLPVYLLTLFYVKKERKEKDPKAALLSLCYTAVLFSFLFNTVFFFTLIQVPLFIYLTGSLCALRSGSISLKDDTYHFVREELRQIFVIPVKKVFLPASCIIKSIHFRADKRLIGITAGCLLSLPVIATVGSLLISGDAAFGNAAQKLCSAFTDFIKELVGNLIDGSNYFDYFIGFFSAFVFSPFVFSALFCFRHGIQKNLSLKNKHTAKSGAFIPQSTASGFYAMICILYALYLFSQLSYFFGAFSGKIPLAVNLTLSEYARRGFFEMSAIAIINLALIALGIIAVKRRADGRISPLFKGIFTFLCLFTLLLIVTAISKMALYITEMGLTHKRILVCIIDLLLTVTILCVLIRLYKGSFPYMKIILCVCVTVMSLYSLIGNSALIASFNTSAYIKGYHAELDIGTIYDETMPLHSVKNLRRIAENPKYKLHKEAIHAIGAIVSEASPYLAEKKLEMSTLKNLCTSKGISDFLFWEYAKDNKDFIMKSLNSYRDYICWQGEY